MFLKIKEEEILNINQIKRIIKEKETIYEETEEYKNYLENHQFSIFFVGNKYTDKVIDIIYKIIIHTCDFEELEFVYDDEQYWLDEFDYIWNTVNLNKESN